MWELKKTTIVNQMNDQELNKFMVRSEFEGKLLKLISNDQLYQSTSKLGFL